jgi:hypothetical protein
MSNLGELMDVYIAAGEAIFGKGYYEKNVKIQEELSHLLGIHEDEGFNDAIRRVCTRVAKLEELLRECHLHIGNRYPDDAAMQRRIDLILNSK